jgi:DNA-binding transcriptional LysR family regulator
MLRRMQGIDLNLLPVLQALLEEEHVTRAAERVHLSVPATSRALERCRKVFGDPLLVRSGRNVVITPRGSELLAELQPVIASIEQMTRRVGPFDPMQLRGTFTIRANEAVIAAIGSQLLERMSRDAPMANLRLQFEGEDDFDRLGDASVDLAIGAYGESLGELCAEHIADEQLVGVVRAGHEWSRSRLTLKRFAALDHVVASRRGRARGPLDDLLAAQGLERRVTAVVPSFSSALALVAQSEAITIAPRRLASLLCGPGGLAMVKVPLDLPLVEVLQVWHRRTDADPANRWLRQCVRDVDT